MNYPSKNPTRPHRRETERSSHGGNPREKSRGAVSNNQPWGPNTWFWIAVFSGMLLMAGYWLATTPGDREPLFEESSAINGSSAKLLLREMLAAYRNVNSYSDQTQIRLEVPTPTGIARESAKISIAFQRPSGLRMNVTRPDSSLAINLASNTERLSVSIVDPTTNDFDGQFVERSAPRKLTVSNVYAGTEYADVSRPNELFSLLTSLPAQLYVSQLAMLLDENPLKPLIDGAEQTTRLEDMLLDKIVCHRVQLMGDDGSFIFWIDADTKLLRRIEFPMGATAAEGSLIADYQKIVVNRPLDAQLFSMATPAGKQVVRNFVLPPMDDPPAILNQPIAQMDFQNPDGGAETLEFEGKVSLLCWFDRSPSSRAAMDALQVVHQNQTENSRVEFVGVFAESTTAVSNAQIRELTNEWKIPFRVVRDIQAHGRDVFQIESTPTLVATDAKGIVQMVEQGVDPQLDQQLPVVLQKLVEQEPLAQGYLDFVEKKRTAYSQTLAMAGAAAPQTDDAFSSVAIKEVTPPKSLKLTKVWESSELKQPGNILAFVEPNDAISIYVVDGGDIVQLDSSGKVTKRLTQQGETQQFTAFNRNGERTYAGWSNLGERVTVWNSDWQPLFQYPSSDDLSKIQSAHLADIDQNKTPELYVAFAGKGDVHRVETAGAELGEMTWSNQPFDPAVAMTSSVDITGTAFVMTAGQGGLVHPINANGISQQEVKIPSRAIHRLVSSDPQDPQSVFCGFSHLPNGELMAIGLDGRLEEQWNYLLPSPTFKTQIAYAMSISLSGSADPLHWVFAGSDGTLHVVSADGQFSDEFALGQPITGIASFRTRAGTHLIVATSQAIRCIRAAK